MDAGCRDTKVSESIPGCPQARSFKCGKCSWGCPDPDDTCFAVSDTLVMGLDDHFGFFPGLRLAFVPAVS